LIRQAFQHLPGIGPERLKRIQELGIADWTDLVQRSEELPLGARGRRQLAEAVEACERALDEADLAHLVRVLAPRDHWRILATYFDRAAYFDIETSGMHQDSFVTLIACYSGGTLHPFVRHENLDRFLDLLEGLELLVSFNGASFDVPKVLREFHIPELACPHIDLRWICAHSQRRGGLKAIERELGLRRPPDLDGVSGEDAVWLWQLWDEHLNRDARDRLIRYCCADTLSLEQVAARLLKMDHGVPLPSTIPADPWSLLDRVAGGPPGAAEPPPPPPAALDPMQRRLQQHWERRRGRAV
jgi:uncharacterized protein YprB with RNaseH-like and TPR domain